jgi:hypothetical protein
MIRFRKDGSLAPYIEVPASYRNALGGAPEDHVRPRHFRAPQAAGRQDQVQEVRPARHRAAVATIPSAGGVEDVVMRILAAGEPIPLEKLGILPQPDQRLNRWSPSPTACSSSAARPVPARPPRCTRCSAPQHAGHQDLDGRGPGRNHPEGPAPGADEPKAGWISPPSCGLPARRPGHHHGRRDARQGKTAPSASRPRSPATWCSPPAHQQRAGVDHPPARHGHGSVQLRRCPARHPGPAPGQAPVQMQGGLRPTQEEMKSLLTEYCERTAQYRPFKKDAKAAYEAALQGVGEELRRGQGQVHALPRQGLRRLRQHRLQGPRRPARTAGGTEHEIKKLIQEHARVAELLATGARRRHAHPEDGRHRESPAGHHRHQAGARGLHQIAKAARDTPSIGRRDLFRRSSSSTRSAPRSRASATSTGCWRTSCSPPRPSPMPTAARSTA